VFLPINVCHSFTQHEMSFVCLCVFMVWLGNGAGPDADAETDINLEVSFSEQALIYKEGLKVTQPQSEADDRLPVSRAHSCVCVCAGPVLLALTGCLRIKLIYYIFRLQKCQI